MSSKKASVIASFLTAVVLIVPLAAAPVKASETAAVETSGGGPVSSVFVVASETQDEVSPAIAYNPHRQEYLVVWFNDRVGCDGIGGQLVSRSGTLRDSVIPIAAGCGHERHDPDVVFNPDAGQYLVVWQDQGDVAGQRLNADGQPVGGEIDIAPYAPPGEAKQPTVAHAAGDGYLVAWSFTGWGSDWHIGAAKIQDDGTVGSVFRLSEDPGGEAREHPDLAYNPRNNTYLAVWQQPSAGNDSVKGCTLAAAGPPPSSPPSPFDISPGLGYDYSLPAVAAIRTAGANGQFLVVYEDHSIGKNISGRLVDGDGTPEPSSFAVGSLFSAGQDSSAPAVAGTGSAGHYLVAWRQDYPAGTLGVSSVYARQISTTGDPTGEGGVDLGVAGVGDPSVAGGPLADFLVAFDAAPLITLNRDVYGQLWGHRLYLPMTFRSFP